MKPVYLDLHIHTSEDADKLNSNYDAVTLLTKIRENAAEKPFLISLTDHNVINGDAYAKLLNSLASSDENVILGAELHVRNYEDAKPYHCHVYFECPAAQENVDNINDILLKLYPKKMVSSEDNIPSLETIVRHLDQYKIAMVPHGGQNHSTFDKSLPPEGDIKFDSVMERNLYYNQFEGFSGRSQVGADKTLRYFERLGIDSFINLVTGSDNYKPENYPEPKASEASEFHPTWMLAEPTFSGLKISLSDSDRLCYGDCPDEDNADTIKQVKLKNERLDIDVTFAPGLNVIIGSASTGKTLLVDSVYRSICGTQVKSEYAKLGVAGLEVNNPSGIEPHYIEQSFISQVSGNIDIDQGFDSVAVFQKIFRSKSEIMQPMTDMLASLRQEVTNLITSVQKTEKVMGELRRIPHLHRLITSEISKDNPCDQLLESIEESILGNYGEVFFDETEKKIEGVSIFLSEHPLLDSLEDEISRIKQEIQKGRIISNLNDEIRLIVSESKDEIEGIINDLTKEDRKKRSRHKELLEYVDSYLLHKKEFTESWIKIATEYNKSSGSKTEKLGGHTLITEHRLNLTKESIVDAFNMLLTKSNEISVDASVSPENFFINKYDGKIIRDKDYSKVIDKLISKLSDQNKVAYSVISKDGADWKTLSPGRKAAVVLDLLLAYDGDDATLIIDQPEDNLAADYISGDLVSSIKRSKRSRQIIVVTHDSTIPILGDAEHVVVCKNDGDNIVIRSSSLEGEIEGTRALDYVADLTDGGKQAVKQRYKKYDLKDLRRSNGNPS